MATKAHKGRTRTADELTDSELISLRAWAEGYAAELDRMVDERKARRQRLNQTLKQANLEKLLDRSRALAKAQAKRGGMPLEDVS